MNDNTASKPEQDSAPSSAPEQPKVHETSDAIDPALRVVKDQQRWKFVSNASIKLNYILAAALLLSAIANGVLGWRAFHPDRQYFASDNGRIIPLIPLSRPHLKQSEVVQIARDTVNKSFTLDFLNWRSQFEGLRPLYTRDGFSSFLKSVNDNSILDTIKKRRMNMAISSGTGVLTKEGVADGIYVWYVEIPIEIRLTGQTSEQPPQRFLAKVRMERTSTLDNLNGVQVGQIITAPPPRD